MTCFKLQILFSYVPQWSVDRFLCPVDTPNYIPFCQHGDVFGHSYCMLLFSMHHPV